MSKNLEAKKVVVSEISEKLKNCQSMVVVHFNGITVENAHLGDSLMSLGYRLRSHDE